MRFLLVLRMIGKLEPEGTAVALRRLGTVASAVLADDGANDRKSKTAAFCGALVGLVDLIVTLPNQRKLFFGNPRTAIADRDSHLAARYALAYGDGLIVARIGQSVV